MTSNTLTHRLVMSAVFVAVAGAVGVSAILSPSEVPASSLSPTMSAEMPGMNHGSGQIPVSSPSPTMSDEMPGMEHGSAEVPASSPSPTMSADMPGMEHGSAETPGEGDHGDAAKGDHGDAVEAAPDQPLVPVLGAFGGGTAVVLLTAGMMRSKDRKRLQARQAARAARAALRSAK